MDQDTQEYRDWCLSGLGIPVTKRSSGKRPWNSRVDGLYDTEIDIKIGVDTVCETCTWSTDNPTSQTHSIPRTAEAPWRRSLNISYSMLRFILGPILPAFLQTFWVGEALWRRIFNIDCKISYLPSFYSFLWRGRNALGVVAVVDCHKLELVQHGYHCETNYFTCSKLQWTFAAAKLSLYTHLRKCYDYLNSATWIIQQEPALIVERASSI